MLLAGLAINSLTGAGTGLLTFLASDPQLRGISFWNLGSVAGAEWNQIGVVLIFSLPLLFCTLVSRNILNAWMLGEVEAHLLGVAVEMQKKIFMVSIALAVGAAVSFTGVIGFVGLIVPHLLRLTLTRNDSTVSEVKGTYGEANFYGSMGMVHHDTIELRLFTNSWAFAIADEHTKGVGTTQSRILLRKEIKNLRQKFLRNPYSVVRHRDDGMVLFAIGLNGNIAAFRNDDSFACLHGGTTHANRGWKMFAFEQGSKGVLINIMALIAFS